MAGPGRPRKIQNEAAGEDIFQDDENKPAETVIESPLVVSDKVAQEPFFEEVEKLDETLRETNEPVSSNGWEPISTVSRSGFPVKLTDDISKPGVVAFWRKTRAFANATHNWDKTGKWTRSDNGMTIDFIPMYWKDRNAE